jgi:tetratricopeptide (TPR) repeat protein
MFFPRLRRRAKWVFALLAVAFALAFVVAGVGSGFGSGIGDYISDIFNRQPSAGGSAGDARDRIKENPKDADAHLDLAKALQADGKTPDAIVALEKYLELRPEDVDALQQLAGLYLIKASEAEKQLRAVGIEAQVAGFGDEVLNPGGQLAKGFEAPPITSALRDDANERYQAAFSAAQEAYRQEADVWRKLTALAPEEPSFFLELGRAAQLSGDSAGAILAYNRYLELAPDAANKAEIKNLVKQLQLQAGGLNSGGSG